jgi:lysophospholipase L1-like esterase
VIHENVLLHNIAEVIPGDHGGVSLQRVPEAVRQQLEPPAQEKTLWAGGAEIRFVMNAPTATVTVSLSAESEPNALAQNDPPTVSVYFGPFANKPRRYEIGIEPTTITIEVEETIRERFLALASGSGSKFAFHPGVVRLVMYRGKFTLHAVHGDVRPPHAAELPDLTMLTYGTSITHGSVASGFHLTYAAQTAWRLGVDLVNLGVGGACLCETAFADYIAGREDWDLATLALSVNMIGRGFSLQEFGERVGYLVERVAASSPGRPVFCITIYPYFGDFGYPQPEAKAPADEFRLELEGIVARLAASGSVPRVQLIPGPSLLTDPGGLSVDLIHPADHGMLQMGENLAARLQPAVQQLRAVRRLQGGED